MFGTAQQQKEWLEPLLDGTIRSGVRDDRAGGRLLRRHATSRRASSATATSTSSTGASGGPSGAADPRCRVCIVMGKTDPEADVLPPAVDGARAAGHPRGDRRAGPAVFGYHDQHGHGGDCSSRTCGCRSTNLIGRAAAASRSLRPGSGPAASTTACGRSAWPSGRWS